MKVSPYDGYKLEWQKGPLIEIVFYIGKSDLFHPDFFTLQLEF